MSTGREPETLCSVTEYPLPLPTYGGVNLPPSFRIARTTGKMPRIERKPHHSPHKRIAIATAFSSSISQAAITAKYDVQRGSISGIVKWYQQQESASSNKRPGRPRILDNRGLRAIKRIVKQDPFVSTREIIDRARLQYYLTNVIRLLRKLGTQSRKWATVLWAFPHE